MLIRFPGDNDYVNPLKKFGALLQASPRFDGLSKAEVVELFSRLMPPLQALSTLHEPRPRATYEAYLVITAEDVYFDEEIEKKLETWTSWGNYDSVLLDWDTAGKPRCTAL